MSARERDLMAQITALQRENRTYRAQCAEYEAWFLEQRIPDGSILRTLAASLLVRAVKAEEERDAWQRQAQRRTG